MVETVIGEIGVGLHDPQLEQFARHQLNHKAADTVAQFLRRILKALNRNAWLKAHGKDLSGGERLVQLRHDKFIAVGKDFAITAHHRALALVIGFLVQLLFRRSKQRVEVQMAGQKPG